MENFAMKCNTYGDGEDNGSNQNRSGEIQPYLWREVVEEEGEEEIWGHDLIQDQWKQVESVRIDTERRGGKTQTEQSEYTYKQR